MLTEVIATTEGIAAWATPATGPFSLATVSALVLLAAALTSSVPVSPDAAEEPRVSAVPTDVCVSLLKYRSDIQFTAWNTIPATRPKITASVMVLPAFLPKLVDVLRSP